MTYINYNLSAFNNTQVNLTTYLIQVNNFTDGWFGILILLAWFIIIYTSLMNHGKHEAIAASAGVTIVFALLIFPIGLLTQKILAIVIVSLSLIALYLIFRK